MEVACDNTACYWNGGKFCKKKVIIMRNGVCGVLVDKHGNWVNQQYWQHPVFDDDEENKDGQD